MCEGRPLQQPRTAVPAEEMFSWGFSFGCILSANGYPVYFVVSRYRITIVLREDTFH